MPRAVWTGAISFGLVSIPVGLFSATQEHTVHFHQFERGTSDRVRIQRVNERTGEEVEYADIVKGAEVGDGEYVVVEQDELDAIAPGRSQSLDISDFVDLAEIDPVHFGRSYWLAPTADQHAKPYALLRRAMADANTAAVGTMVMRGKEYLVAVRADGDVLALHTLHFADEIRDPGELDHVPGGRTGAGDKELTMAARLIESMTAKWEPEQYHDSYRDRVEALIADKRQGREIVTESAPPEPTEMSDLLAALQRSIEQAGGGRKPAAKKESGGKDTDEKDTAKKDTGTKEPSPDDLPKKELLRLARELDVSGRSTMTRAELAAAVRQAS
jgi:DNA end-binding protein Ku